MSRTRQRLGKSAMAAGLVALVAAATVAGVPYSTTSDAEAQSVDDRPNIMIIVTDDQREGLDNMPRTRHFFAKQGRTYSNAYVTTPQCCPSRGSIMTGRYAHNHSIRDNYTAPTEFPFADTLQARLQDEGYTTGLVGKFLNGWPNDKLPPNFDFVATQKAGYRNSMWNINGLMTSIDGYNTDTVGDKAVDFIEANRTSPKPWMMFVAPFAPHSPYSSEPAYRSIPVADIPPTPAAQEADRSDKPPFIQQANVAYQPTGALALRKQQRTLRSVDDMVTRLGSELRRNGEENTIAVFISDNGYLMGEHGFMGKKVPYTEAVKVPLYIRWPGVIPARTVDDRIVANIDLMPTLLHAAGASINDPDDVDGRPLLDETWTRERILLEFDGCGSDACRRWASTRTPAYQYVEHYDGDGAVTFREYYDLAKDPWQLRNLFHDSSSKNNPAVAPLRAQLAADLACVGQACP